MFRGRLAPDLSEGRAQPISSSPTRRSGSSPLVVVVLLGHSRPLVLPPTLFVVGDEVPSKSVEMN